MSVLLFRKVIEKIASKDNKLIPARLLDNFQMPSIGQSLAATA